MLRYQPRTVELEIADDGAGRRRLPISGDASESAGHGIAGMRERVKALDGQITVAPDPTAGFTVRAEFPLQPEQGQDVKTDSGHALAAVQESKR